MRTQFWVFGQRTVIEYTSVAATLHAFTMTLEDWAGLGSTRGGTFRFQYTPTGLKEVQQKLFLFMEEQKKKRIMIVLYG
jgi:hypothetical protein